MQLTLKQARVIKGLTQIDLANELGVSEKTYIKYEQDPSQMRIAQAQRVSELLEVRFDGAVFLPTDDIPGGDSNV